MTAKEIAAKLVASGMSLRKMRMAFQVELHRQALAKAGKQYIARARELRISDDAVRWLERRTLEQSRVAMPAGADELITKLANSLSAHLQQIDYHTLLASFDREIVGAAVAAGKGKKTAAARMLGVHRNMIPVLLTRTWIRAQL